MGTGVQKYCKWPKIGVHILVIAIRQMTFRNLLSNQQQLVVRLFVDVWRTIDIRELSKSALECLCLLDR